MKTFPLPENKAIYLLYPWVLAGLALRLWRVSLQLVMFRDETTYAYQIKHILDGTIFSDATYFTFPPAYPLLAAPFALVTGDPELAGRLVTSLAGAATAIPVYYLSRDLFGEKAAAVAAAVTALFPPLMGIGVMAEQTYGFFVALGIYLAYRALASGRARDGLYFGLAMAAAYLSRPEGFFIFLPCLAVMMVVMLRDKAAKHRIPALAGAALAGFFILALPYMVQLRMHFGAWEISGKTRINLAKAKASETLRPDEDIEEKAAQVYDELEKKQGSVGQNVLGEMGAIMKRYPGNLAAEFTSLPAIAGYPLLLAFMTGAGFALAGPGRLRRLGVITTALTPLFVIPAVFVMDRILMPYIPVIIIIASNGAARLAEYAGSKAKDITGKDVAAPAAGVMGAFLFLGNFGGMLPETDTMKVLEADESYGYYFTLRQVAEECGPLVKPGGKMITRNNISAYYAGAEYLPIPYADLDGLVKYARENGARYLFFGPLEQDMRPQLMPAFFQSEDMPRSSVGGGAFRLVYFQDFFLLYEFVDGKSYTER